MNDNAGYEQSFVTPTTATVLMKLLTAAAMVLKARIGWKRLTLQGVLQCTEIEMLIYTSIKAMLLKFLEYRIVRNLGVVGYTEFIHMIGARASTT